MVGRINCIPLDGRRHGDYTFHWYLDNYHHHDDIALLVHIHQMISVPIMGVLQGSVFMNDMYTSTICCIKRNEHLLIKYERLCEEKKVKYNTLLLDEIDSPGHIICEVAKKQNADAIIMGVKKHALLERIILGSVSDYVLHHSKVPVIMVPTEYHESK